MKWSGIRQKYPNKFILIGNIVEKEITETHSRIIAGDVLEVSTDGKTIQYLSDLC